MMLTSISSKTAGGVGVPVGTGVPPQLMVGLLMEQANDSSPGRRKRKRTFPWFKLLLVKIVRSIVRPNGFLVAGIGNSEG
jgi:hypothetical protein